MNFLTDYLDYLDIENDENKQNEPRYLTKIHCYDIDLPPDINIELIKKFRKECKDKKLNPVFLGNTLKIPFILAKINYLSVSDIFNDNYETVYTIEASQLLSGRPYITDYNFGIISNSWEQVKTKGDTYLVLLNLDSTLALETSVDLTQNPVSFNFLTHTMNYWGKRLGLMVSYYNFYRVTNLIEEIDHKLIPVTMPPVPSFFKNAEKLEYFAGRKHYLMKMHKIIKHSHIAVTGKSGVGKTVLCKEFANFLINQNKKLKKEKFKVFMLDTNEMIANTKYTGQIEEKVKQMLSYLDFLHNMQLMPVIILDEIAGNALSRSGDVNRGYLPHNSVMDLLKKILSEHDCPFKMIVTCTTEEFNEINQYDPPLARRFQVLEMTNSEEDINSIIKSATRYFKIKTSCSKIKALADLIYPGENSPAREIKVILNLASVKEKNFYRYLWKENGLLVLPNPQLIQKKIMNLNNGIILGRKAQLEAISRCLLSGIENYIMGDNDKSCLSVITIAGPAGVGKFHIASEISKLLSKNVFVLNADGYDINKFVDEHRSTTGGVLIIKGFFSLKGTDNDIMTQAGNESHQKFGIDEIINVTSKLPGWVIFIISTISEYDSKLIASTSKPVITKGNVCFLFISQPVFLSMKERRKVLLNIKKKITGRLTALCGQSGLNKKNLDEIILMADTPNKIETLLIGTAGIEVKGESESEQWNDLYLLTTPVTPKIEN